MASAFERRDSEEPRSVQTTHRRTETRRLKTFLWGEKGLKKNGRDGGAGAANSNSAIGKNSGREKL